MNSLWAEMGLLTIVGSTALTVIGLLRGPHMKMATIFRGRPLKRPISVNQFSETNNFLSFP